MAKLVLTLVGEDRAGLVQAVADVIAAHGGNWERSELAELAGAFAGVVLVSVPEDRLADLTTELEGLRGILNITPHAGAADAPPGGERFVFTVLGNDRPGIVREVTRALVGRGLSIDRFTSRTLDAPMSGGTLFEAVVSVRVTPDADVAAATADLERLAGEIQVDLTVG
ncbi:glycine cleavage system protein R [Microbacterium ulmi]|uniref:ACT domain-containing protein n=1 Tax=Microbacterium ulmi TaxID=179095 RepID=A0A7Y2M128_9MICO|nr:ACT domain-containing protein [Microbacterium ulmi]NII71002.1 glycine cleavage system regulatory protein [Microbacterium ulmi]NNH04232.1 ACT domain-containing protein [Microbacterium ulmi]